MTSTQLAEPAHAAPGAAKRPAEKCLFSEQEVAEFRAQDRFAATAVAGLMVFIFLLAVAGYSFVAWWVGSGR